MNSAIQSEHIDKKLTQDEKTSYIKAVMFSIFGTATLMFLIANTLFHFAWFPILGILKFLIPIVWFSKICTKLISVVGMSWISVNNFLVEYLLKVKVNVEGTDNLTEKDWYLVISNHQSWVDIIILQKIFNRRIPFLKFFLKKELIWVPFMGIAWWALDFPFMKRYSRAFIEKNPHLKGKDIEITRKACEKFRYMPVSVMNFVEGTRFTKEKHERQKPPFKYLLKPKAGGFGFVFTAMGEYLHSILNVTIIYPQERKDIWSFLCGRVRDIDIIVKKIPVTPDLIGNYSEDSEYQERFKKWVNDLWQEKDDLIASRKEK